VPGSWDYRDLVIEQLADELAEMTERAVLAEADREVRRVMMQEALGQVARITAQLNEARMEILRLRAAERRTHARPDRHAA
jgi:cobalamin biosynthesis Mg chelatase CobN